jgi:hypothetical protein
MGAHALNNQKRLFPARAVPFLPRPWPGSDDEARDAAMLLAFHEAVAVPRSPPHFR